MGLSSRRVLALLGFASRARGIATKLAPQLVEDLAGGGELAETDLDIAADDSGRLDRSWQKKVAHVLRVPDIENAENQTAFVTFAGKKDLTYVDGAVMLGMSIQKHAPGYPMVAIVIEHMAGRNKLLLEKAGWSIAVVPNWEAEYCGSNCDLQFLGRWHDSFEKVNTFRLPFQRVVFLDADTYVFSPRIQELVTMVIPPDHIAMAMDGCKSEYNSGVLVYRPDISLFMNMLDMVSHRERNDILDQSIINSAFSGKVVEISREFNCVDIMGIQPSQREECMFKCGSNVVVSHFTGHPKPTAGERRLLELVRRPSSPGLACTNTNFGSCAKWSEFYCDMRHHSGNLSGELQTLLESAGPCCHSPYDSTQDRLSCKECPALMSFIGSKDLGDKDQNVDGVFMKTTIMPGKLHGGKPIYQRRGNRKIYMYYFQQNLMWLIGDNYSSNTLVLAYAAKESQCPRDAGAWHFIDNGGEWQMHPLVHFRESAGAPADPEHTAFDVTLGSWVPWEPSFFLQSHRENRDLEHSASNVTANSSEHGPHSGTTDLEHSGSGVAANSSQQKTHSGEKDSAHSASHVTANSSERGAH